MFPLSAVLRIWHKLVNMNDRINKRIFILAELLQNVRFKNWKIFLQHNIETFCNINVVLPKNIIKSVLTQYAG